MSEKCARSFSGEHYLLNSMLIEREGGSTWTKVVSLQSNSARSAGFKNLNQISTNHSSSPACPLKEKKPQLTTQNQIPATFHNELWEHTVVRLVMKKGAMQGFAYIHECEIRQCGVLLTEKVQRRDESPSASANLVSDAKMTGGVFLQLKSF